MGEALQPGHLLIELGHIRAVALIADREASQRERQHDADQTERAALQPRAQPFEARVRARQRSLAEDHVLQEPVDEVRAASRSLIDADVMTQAKRLRECADRPIDRPPLLGAAREVHAAQQRWRVIPGTAERVVEEAAQRGLQTCELLRKPVDQRAPPHVALALHAGQHACLQPFAQRVELGGKRAERLLGAAGFVERKSDPPHLFALVLAEVVEELREARQQVAFRHDQIDRQARAETLRQFAQTGAHQPHMRGTRGVVLLHQIRGGQRDDDPVQRPARAILAQQAQEAVPGGLIGLRIAILGRIAAGGIDQHSLVGEPPVAVTRAADAANRILAQRVAQRKAQAGMLQRCRLASARRADEHVPRQLIEPLAAEAALHARLAQHRERLLEALPQQRSFGAGGA